MDPFTEKQLLDTLKAIATNLQGIKEELSEINLAILEAAEGYGDDDDDDEDDEDTDDDSGEFVEISN